MRASALLLLTGKLMSHHHVGPQIGLLIGSVGAKLTRKRLLSRMNSVVTPEQALIPALQNTERTLESTTARLQVDEVKLIKRSDVGGIGCSGRMGVVDVRVLPYTSGQVKNVLGAFSEREEPRA